MKRIAFYGGSFDPVHNGHIEISRAVSVAFALDSFVFIPAFHAPHKARLKPTSPYDRYAMLCLATKNAAELEVSKMEIELPEKPYSVETLTRLVENFPKEEIYFVMGADSWMDIKTWREWETVLTLTNHIVVTRPGYEISISHVTDKIQERISDVRNSVEVPLHPKPEKRIYLTNLVNMDVSATEIRKEVREHGNSWKARVAPEVAIYIEKYQIYS
jgi:nicotinate-nucleotide adenylyltransferase